MVLQSEQALDAVLVWEVIGEAFFNPDVAIERTLADTLGAQTSSNFRDAAPVDGRPARMALSETAMGEGSCRSPRIPGTAARRPRILAPRDR